MDSENGGKSSFELQKQTAAAIARKKVLEAYARAAEKSSQQSNNTHLKEIPVTSKINSESWKRYHSAWQDYYQKYYSSYYSKAAQSYIARERQKDAAEKAKQAEALELQAKESSKKKRFTGFHLKTANSNTTNLGTANLEVANQSAEQNSENPETTILGKLKATIRKNASDDATKARRRRKIIPLIAGISVALLILFLQYNRLIFAPIMAYVSPGNAPASEIEALDPTVTQAVSDEPRLIIPKLNIDVPVHYGVPLSGVMSAMNNGVAHYRIAGASAYPGEVGNFVITGHSAGDIYSSNPYKYIFSGLERLENGDLIYVNYNSKRYTYRVIKKEVVEPTNVAALVVNTDKPLLTLVTCTPLGTSRYRLLVTAEQISPSPTGATQSEEPVEDVKTQSLPANEPSFFEGIWNWLTGN